MSKEKKLKNWQKGLIISLSVVVGLGIIATGTIFGLWGNEISSVNSLKMLDKENKDNRQGPVYEMTVKGEYYFDSFIKNGGAKNDQELIDHIVKNITKGIIPITIKAPEIGCSSFTAINENGDRVFGRNYDFSTTTSMILKTNPGKGRYKSISNVDLQFLGIKDGQPLSSFMQKVLTLAAPYVPLDGINEKGLSCGIYMSYQGDTDKVTPTNQNTDKPDLTSTTMLRLILDTAATVDEAVEIAKSYDLHDSANTSFHYMVADKTGKSAILEWVGTDSKNDLDGSKRKLNVIYNDQDQNIGDKESKDNFQYVTNFVVSENYYSNDDDKGGLDRYNKIQEMINPDGTNTEGRITDEQGLNILKTVGRRKWDSQYGDSDKNGITCWSSYYNLNELTMKYVSNEKFDDDKSIFTYSLKN